MMVTAPEAAALLATAATFDNREPDQYAARAWAEALADVDFKDARAFVVEHYRREHWKVTPSHIIKGVKAMEAERIANGPNVEELELPEWLAAMDDGPEFNAAYASWLQEVHRRIRRGIPLGDSAFGAPVIPSERQWTALAV